MQALWLSTSDDINPRIRVQDRGPAIAMRRLEQATAETFSVEVRPIWPTPDLPKRVERWLERYEPDVVFIVVPAFWSTYESVPVKLRRRVPVLGGTAAIAGLKASATPWVSENPAFRALRRYAVRIYGGETNFTSKEVLKCIEDVLRLILARENTVVAVRGPTYPDDSSLSAAGFARAERRRQELHLPLKRLCDNLHVSYVGWDKPLYQGSIPAHLLGDDLHMNAATHEEQGRQWGDVLAEAWKKAHQVSQE